MIDTGSLGRCSTQLLCARRPRAKCCIAARYQAARYIANRPATIAFCGRFTDEVAKLAQRISTLIFRKHRAHDWVALSLAV
jgi:hypothetical protein